MASVSKLNDGTSSMAEEEQSQQANAGAVNKADTAPESVTPKQRADESAAERRRPAGEGGFFTIYKPGQGYWTRMGTAIVAALLGALTAHFLYTHVPNLIDGLFLPNGFAQMPATEQATARANVAASVRTTTIIITALFVIGYVVLVYWLINRPSNADFLIATDSEMKKVNWATKQELIGSTKVVVMFLLMIAVFLFVIDQVLGLLFWAINVLQFPPFFISPT